MSVPDRPVSSIDIMEELGHGGVGPTDDDVVVLTDVGTPVGQLDLERLYLQGRWSSDH